MRETRPRLKHTAKPVIISPSISAEMLTIAVCTHADRAERAPMVSIHSVVVVIDCSVVRAMETRC